MPMMVLRRDLSLKDSETNFVSTFFLTIARFLEQTRMEHIQSKNSLKSKLYLMSLYSVRIPSRNRDIFKKTDLV